MIDNELLNMIARRRVAMRQQKHIDEQRRILTMTLKQINEDLMDDIGMEPIAPKQSTAQRVANSQNDYAYSLSFTIGYRVWNQESYIKGIDKVPFVQFCGKLQQILDSASFIDAYELDITMYALDVLLDKAKSFNLQSDKADFYDWCGINPDIKSGRHSFVERAVAASYEKPSDKEVVSVNSHDINLTFTIKFDPDDFLFKEIVRDFMRLEKLFNVLINYLTHIVTVTKSCIDLYDFSESENYDIIDNALIGTTNNNLKNYIDLRYSHIWNVAKRITSDDKYQADMEDILDDGQRYEPINKYTAADALKQLVINLAKDDFYTWRLEGFELFPKTTVTCPTMYVNVSGVKDEKKNTITNLKKHLHKAFSTFTNQQIKEMNYILKYQTVVYVAFSEDVTLPKCDTDDADKIMYDWIFEKKPFTFRFRILNDDFMQFRNDFAADDPIKNPYYNRVPNVSACQSDDAYNCMKGELDKVYWHFKLKK